MLNQTDRAKIEALQDYMDRIAHNIVRTHYPQLDPADLLSVMNETVVTLAAKSPKFLDQKKGYITRKAAWAARDWARHEVLGLNKSPVSLDADSADATTEEAFGASFVLDLDLDLPLDILAALRTLDEKRQEMAVMIMQGWKRKDIAAHFGIKSPSLTTHYKVIAAALAPLRA